jgi:hypothetical protein
MFALGLPTGLDVVAAAAAAHAALVQIAQSVQLLPALNPTDRRLLEARIRRVAPMFLSAFVTVAANHGGVLMGQPFDVEGARRTLAYCEAFGHVARDLETQARAFRDDVDQRYGELMDLVLGIFASIKRGRKTPNGKALEGDLQQLIRLYRELIPSRQPAASPDPTQPDTSSAGSTASTPASAGASEPHAAAVPGASPPGASVPGAAPVNGAAHGNGASPSNGAASASSASTAGGATHGGGASVAGEPAPASAASPSNGAPPPSGAAPTNGTSAGNGAAH